ncbi:MAG: hypothetical protein MZV70_01485 [Desulfobacterales bacterium]|nr:hypothetical protein [Desulfobacterales bacterium]
MRIKIKKLILTFILINFLSCFLSVSTAQEQEAKPTQEADVKQEPSSLNVENPQTPQQLPGAITLNLSKDASPVTLEKR